jgi:NAD(P)-dependent dehydrogenase (short-subunit alcohol dehydrogenase family)
MQRALIIGATSGVGRATAGALTSAGVQVVATGSERDATDPAEVAALLTEADPDLVVIAAGARPRMAPLGEQTWESFSEPWNVDVKIAFEVGRAILAHPLRPGSTVVIMSSGAALHGSPLSGGYAGAKRMQMFLAGYLQRTAAYGAEVGESPETYMKRFPAPLDAEGAARAVVAVATGEEQPAATVLTLSGNGLEAV